MAAEQTDRAGVALVTGASEGIGRAISRALAVRGFNLVLTARSEARLLELADVLREEGVDVFCIASDLSEAGAADELYHAASSVAGPVDLLANNAGAGVVGAFATNDWEREQRIIALNVVSLTRLTKLVLSDMLARNAGRILNIASTAALRPGPFSAVYSASKAFVLSFSAAVSAEVAGTGVTVTAVCPGATDTRFLDVATNGALSLRGRGRSPEDLAAFALRATFAGKTVAVHGMGNRLLPKILPWIPAAAFGRFERWRKRPR